MSKEEVCGPVAEAEQSVQPSAKASGSKAFTWPAGPPGSVRIRVDYFVSPEGRLAVFSDDMLGLILSGADADAVAADVWPAMKALVWAHATRALGLALP